MKNIILQNFIKPSNGEQVGLHKSIAGFMPNYMDLVDQSLDQETRNKVNPPYSLILSPEKNVISAKSGRKIACIAPLNFTGDDNKIIYSTDLWNFYSVDDGAEVDYGLAQSVGSSLAIDIVSYGGIFFTTHFAHNKMRIRSGGLWLNHTGTPVNLTSNSIKLFRFFRNDLLISDSNKIYDVSSSGELSNSFELVVGNHGLPILDYNVFRDEFVTLFFEYDVSSKGNLYNKTDFILWNGVDSNYEFRNYVQGKFRCSITKDSATYIFTQLGTDLICWVFGGVTFEKVGVMKNVVVSTDILNPKMRISIEKDFFVLMASSPNNLSSVSPFYWNPSTGDNFFLFNQAADNFGIFISQNPLAKYQRYFSYEGDSGNGELQKIIIESPNRDNSAFYKSGVIPIPEQRGRIARVVVEYNAPPPSADDVITFTLKTKDESESEDIIERTAIIKDTTDNSINARVSPRRAVMDFSALCSELEVELSLSKQTPEYWLIVRRIVIDYEPIAQKE